MIPVPQRNMVVPCSVLNRVSTDCGAMNFWLNSTITGKRARMSNVRRVCAVAARTFRAVPCLSRSVVARFENAAEIPRPNAAANG